MKNFLSIDYGERRVGIAFASESVGIAFPRETIDCKDKDLWAELHRLVAENKVSDFVLGVPIHPNSHPDSKESKVRAFAAELKAKFPNVEIHLQDESYSTQEASTAMGKNTAKANGANIKAKSKQSKERIDKAAAAVILRRFLEGNF